ncbi:surf-like protein [Spiromyces aspiralis]|uniref:Surf-like protein n=1 Tax=Spiromyces aspiralis TaxID=68401 RepID=A0ACC1HEB9_9FUNG|nr:surf-like protein [Spiromyces aspiralis]
MNSPEVYDKYKFRKVIVYGKYEHDKEMLVGPRVKDGVVGFDIVTPLVREDGTRVLVKRGWIRKEFANRGSRPESLVDEPIALQGFLTKGQRPNRFTPPSYPERNEWYIANIDEMSHWAGTQPVLVEEIIGGSSLMPSQYYYNMKHGIPIPREPTFEIANDHLQYLITWYSLSVITAAMLYYSVRRPKAAMEKIKKIRRQTNSHWGQ